MTIATNLIINMIDMMLIVGNDYLHLPTSNNHYKDQDPILGLIYSTLF